MSVLDPDRFKFKEDDRVALCATNPYSDLNLEGEGVVFALYNSDPPSYEVNWKDVNGVSIGMVMDEEEICKADGIEPEPRESEGDPQSQSVDRGR
jgi:hypothetical protein